MACSRGILPKWPVVGEKKSRIATRISNQSSLSASARLCFFRICLFFEKQIITTTPSPSTENKMSHVFRFWQRTQGLRPQDWKTENAVVVQIAVLIPVAVQITDGM